MSTPNAPDKTLVEFGNGVDQDQTAQNVQSDR